MSVQLLESAEKKPITGPVILETYWWPRHVVGLAGRARRSVDEWRDDLVKQGTKGGDVVEFIPEDVIGRFKLSVNWDGSFRVDEELTPIGECSGSVYIADDGETAATLPMLAGQIYDTEFDRKQFPVTRHVRVSIVRDVIPMKLVFVDDCILKFRPLE